MLITLKETLLVILFSSANDIYSTATIRAVAIVIAVVIKVFNSFIISFY